MLNYDSLLKQTLLLQDLNYDDIKTYIQEGKFEIISYKKNTVVHMQGDVCNKLEIIISGKVAVERLDKSGGLLTISEFFKNDILGGNLLFSKQPNYPMTISTKDASVLIGIDKEFLFTLFIKNPSFLRKYLEYVSDHSLILSYKINSHINKTIRESLITYLGQESILQNSKKIALNMSKKVLADKIGVQRTSLSRELAKMKNDGLIIFDRDSITIVDDKLFKP